MDNYPSMPDVTDTIRDLFRACGAQSFQSIVYDVQTQVVGVTGLKQSVAITKAALSYLTDMGAIVRVDNEYGEVWGDPSDF